MKEEVPTATDTAVFIKETATIPIIADRTVTPDELPSATATQTMTPTPFPTPSPTFDWVTWTPEAPLPVETAKAKVAELLDTNGGCKLPCWWGIQPGKTKFPEAIKYLSEMDPRIWIKEIDGLGSLNAELKFSVSKTVYPRSLSQWYQVEKNIIQELEVMPADRKSYIYRQIIHDYGVPDEVWIEGLIDPSSNNPFTIFLYYPKQGILAGFWLDGIDLGEKLRVCPSSAPSQLLILWNPEDQESFIDFAGKTNSLAYIKKENRVFTDFEQATGLKLEKINERNCFETPKNLWPVR